jgi:hypothetical protein
MKTCLTPFLLDFMVDQGYQYLLSKTENINRPEASVQITLTPVIQRPQLRRLPRDFDTYFRLTKEPRIMANGIDDTRILVSLSPEDVAILKQTLLNKYSKQQQYA